MRFHVLGVSHAKTHREYSVDAFSQKIRLLCAMLHRAGHTVYHYGTEGSEVEATEHVSVVSRETYERSHPYDWRTTAFDTGRDNDAYREFQRRAAEEIAWRSQPRDFLLCGFGLNHQPIAQELAGKLPIVVEPGIGYEHTFAPHRVFESYPWMHYLYGKEGRMMTPSLYDAVIPNYYDLADYPFSAEKDDYFFMLARPTPAKGWEIAARVCDAIGAELITAGQGNPFEQIKPPRLHTHVGCIGIEERGRLLSRAQASFVPTTYLEPFGGTVIESLLCGTPVITTDFGAFSDTVAHGIVGYRCRTLEQFVWAARNIDRISPKVCRMYAKANYAMERVSLMYEEYFATLARLYANPKGWYGEYPERAELDWLTRF